MMCIIHNSIVVISRFKYSTIIGCSKRRFLTTFPMTRMLHGIAITTKSIRKINVAILTLGELSSSGSGKLQFLIILVLLSPWQSAMMKTGFYNSWNSVVVII